MKLLQIKRLVREHVKRRSYLRVVESSKLHCGGRNAMFLGVAKKQFRVECTCFADMDSSDPAPGKAKGRRCMATLTCPFSL